MPVEPVYQQIYELLQKLLCVGERSQKIGRTTLKRVAFLVMGIIKAKAVSPARVARALELLGLSGASVQSIERRLRRIENDVHLDQQTFVHPLVRYHLALTKLTDITLIVDPTYDKDRLAMVTVAAWYRGQALPLAWELWPHDQPLEGDRFWMRVTALLQTVAHLLPSWATVVVLADRAFGTPAFTDEVRKLGWHFVVRVQQQTRFRDRMGKEGPLSRLIGVRSCRGKGRVDVFKKRGWRELSAVGYWGRRHKSALIVVSDLAPCWDLLLLYRQRYGIEALFKHLKSHGWDWEQSQVRSGEHWERLLVAMALASWLVLSTGTACARDLLGRVIVGRSSCPPAHKTSLFTMGLDQWQRWLSGLVCREGTCERIGWFWEWVDQNWRDQYCGLYARAYVFAA
jgi:hypothetical protein